VHRCLVLDTEYACKMDSSSTSMRLREGASSGSVPILVRGVSRGVTLIGGLLRAVSLAQI
jgi:hypothetical protein